MNRLVVYFAFRMLLPECLLSVLVAILRDTHHFDKAGAVLASVWSDASTHPLGLDKCKNKYYPQEMPNNFDELTDWWNLRQGGRMNFHAERLIVFAPDASAWNEIGNHWENTIYHPAKAGLGLTDVDYETIMAAIVKSV